MKTRKYMLKLMKQRGYKIPLTLRLFGTIKKLREFHFDKISESTVGDEWIQTKISKKDKLITESFTGSNGEVFVYQRVVRRDKQDEKES